VPVQQRVRETSALCDAALCHEYGIAVQIACTVAATDFAAAAVFMRRVVRDTVVRQMAAGSRMELLPRLMSCVFSALLDHRAPAEELCSS
jgi:hypothetical protein